MVDPSEHPSTSHLNLLYRLSQQFNSSLDLVEVLNQVVDEVLKALHAERGFVMLVDSDGELVFKVARGIEQKSIDHPNFQISRGIVETVATKGLAILSSDAQTDDRFSVHASVMSLGLRSVLCVPLIVKDKIIGVVYVDNRLKAGIFTQADLNLLSAIATNAAIAIENARLYQIAMEKGRMERELQIAYKVQASLLPKAVPEINGWEFAARWKPAQQVSGDYYDFLPDPGDQLGLVIADVTDKGMPAALFMAFTRSIVRASLSQSDSLSKGVAKANTLIATESTYGFFVTMFYARLDASTGGLFYVNAGHNPPLVYHADTKELIGLHRTGIPLGIELDWEYGLDFVQLGPGDCILLYTDGVIDAFDVDQNAFGVERLQKEIILGQELSASELLDAIEQAIEDFTGGHPQYDDITMVLAKRLQS